MKIVSVAEMQAIERIADSRGLSYKQMMINAGNGIANWILAYISINKGVIGLVGSGNNGGDTLIAVTELAKRGARTTAFLVKKRQGDPLIDSYLHAGGSIIDLTQPENIKYLKAVLIPGVVVLDGILGTGLRLPIRGALLDRMADIKNTIENGQGARVVAVDCPSGVNCDTGEASEAVIRANDTLCIAAVKKGLLKPPGRLKAGHFHLVDIGIQDLSEFHPELLDEMMDSTLVTGKLLQRSDFGHKGTFGTCMVVAGTPSFAGAAFLAGKAAYLSGAGLVHMVTHPVVHYALAGRAIEAVWTILPSVKDGFDPDGVESLIPKLSQADALVLGPGWGLSDQTGEFLDRLLSVIPPELPTLIDADGLKLLSRLKSCWGRLPQHTVLTPHPGEMAIMTGLPIEEIQSHRWEIAQTYAKRWDVTLVLKGAITVVATPEGRRFINPVSDSALATAGSGDVLAGMIGGLMAQGINSVDASMAGVYVHSRAGVLARKIFGSSTSVTALDILMRTPYAFAEMKKAH